MGVPTSEVGYTSATTGRGDHEVHKGHVEELGKNMYVIDRRGSNDRLVASAISSKNSKLGVNSVMARVKINANTTFFWYVTPCKGD
jgi:hypothetical protein